MKTKESQNLDIYLDSAKELKKFWDTKVTMMQAIVWALGTVSKNLKKWIKELEIRGRIKNNPDLSIAKSRSG